MLHPLSIFTSDVRSQPQMTNAILYSPFASSMMAPAIISIDHDLHSPSTTLDTFSISIFMLGVGAGPLILAPLSELYGRNLIYHFSNFFFTITSVACAKAPNMNFLVGFRLLAGIAGSALISNGGGTIADIVPKESRGLITTLMLVGQLIGPVIGPTVGGYVSQGLGWRWIFWLLSIIVSHLAPRRSGSHPDACNVVWSVYRPGLCFLARDPCPDTPQVESGKITQRNWECPTLSQGQVTTSCKGSLH